jgi:hypothetical protein
MYVRTNLVSPGIRTPPTALALSHLSHTARRRITMKIPKPMPGIEATLKFAAVYLRAIDAPKSREARSACCREIRLAKIVR